MAPVPFVVGEVAPHAYCIVKVFSKVQFNAQPANRREMQTGALPSYTNITFSAGDEPVRPVEPRGGRRDATGGPSPDRRDLRGAIQHYRKALDLDANDPVVFNDLAWMLSDGRRTPDCVMVRKPCSFPPGPLN